MPLCLDGCLVGGWDIGMLCGLLYEYCGGLLVIFSILFVGFWVGNLLESLLCVVEVVRG